MGWSAQVVGLRRSNVPRAATTHAATLEMLADLARFFEEDPERLRTFKQSRKRNKRPSA